MKKFVRIAIMIVLGLSSAVPAFAADDDVLVRILTRANIANNFTEYCAQFDLQSFSVLEVLLAIPGPLLNT